MSDKNIRKPFRNFFIKKSIQIKMTGKIILVVFASTLVTTAFLTYIYNSKSKLGSFYYMSNDIMQDLELTSILGVILPPLITSQAIGILIALGIGLFSSRKIAVPLYKVEKWAARIRTGNLKANLSFRKEDELKELTLQCNAVTEFYRRTFSELNACTEAIEQRDSSDPQIKQHIKTMKQIIEKIQY